MLNCIVVGNYATDQAGVIYACDNTVHLYNTYFKGNMAINRGGAILIENMSLLQIENCTFRNNSVNTTFGFGGAILIQNNSLVDLSNSIFDHNKASQGGTIQQQNGKVTLNQCVLSGNSENAIAGLRSEIYIVNSLFKYNLAKLNGGAVIVERSVLNVSNTTFKNNVQTSDSTLTLYQPVRTKAEGGGAICLSHSIGSISKSRFCNNSVSYWGVSMFAARSSLSICDTTVENNLASVFGGAISCSNCSININNTTFENNGISNKVIGMGGCLYLEGNSTMKISNVLLSKCYAIKGGAIRTNFTTIIMSDSSVIANRGLAIFFLSSDIFEIRNSTFFNNSSPEDGGALICLTSCVVKIVNAIFNKNTAVHSGGAIDIERRSKLTAHNCSFTDNSAYQGGAVNLISSDFYIFNSNFSHNVGTKGGVTFYSSGSVSMLNCHISKNTALGNGRVFNNRFNAS